MCVFHPVAMLAQRRNVGRSSRSRSRSASPNPAASITAKLYSDEVLDHLYGVEETNFRRLLRKCEDMCDRGDYETWRFEKVNFVKFVHSCSRLID